MYPPAHVLLRVHSTKNCSERSIFEDWLPLLTRNDSVNAAAVNAQQAPHEPWLFTDVIIPEDRWSTEVGAPNLGALKAGLDTLLLSGNKLNCDKPMIVNYFTFNFVLCPVCEIIDTRYKVNDVREVCNRSIVDTLTKGVLLISVIFAKGNCEFRESHISSWWS